MIRVVIFALAALILVDAAVENLVRRWRERDDVSHRQLMRELSRHRSTDDAVDSRLSAQEVHSDDVR